MQKLYNFSKGNSQGTVFLRKQQKQCSGPLFFFNKVKNVFLDKKKKKKIAKAIYVVQKHVSRGCFKNLAKKLKE